MLAERIDLERHLAAVGAADFLVGEVDGQRRIGDAFGVVEQLVEVFLGNADRQDAVLEAVVVKNVAERGRDHAADAEVEQGPWGMIGARRASEYLVSVPLR